jgi:uncharacterized protein YgbK (DUF1537 family)
MDALGTDFTIACPAFPDNGRTVFKGYLFVGDELLHESGMRNHPLTPMTDSNLVRVLQAQTQRKVGLIDYRSVARGAAGIAERIAQLRAQGVQMAVVDATSNAELLAAGPAWAAHAAADRGLRHRDRPAAELRAARGRRRRGRALPAARGLRAIVSGSCSVATNGQVRNFLDARWRGLRHRSAAAGARGRPVGRRWPGPTLACLAGPVLVYATAEPKRCAPRRRSWAWNAPARWWNRRWPASPAAWCRRGVGQLVVAGGETSGSVVQALGVSRLRIGPQIAPGVPWCHARPSLAPEGLHLALKSGNFGGPACPASPPTCRCSIRSMLSSTASRPPRATASKGVEYLFPYEHEPRELAARLRPTACSRCCSTPPRRLGRRRARLGLPAGARGGVPRPASRKALRYAEALACPRIHVMAGLVPPGQERAELRPTYVANLRWAAVEAAKQGVNLLLEPINTRDIPRFFLNRQDHAHELLARSAPSTCRCRWTCTTARSSRATWR